MRRSQRGFAAVLAILLVAFLVAVVGYIAYRKYHHINSVISRNTSTNTEAQSFNQNSYQGDITQKLHLQTIKLSGTGQQGIAVDPNTGYVYVGAYSGINNRCMAGNPNQGQSLLNIVDPTQAKQVAAVQTDEAPIWPAVDDQKGVVYLATSSGSVAIHKLGTGEKLGSIHVGGLPHMPALLGNLMVVSNTYDQSETYYSVVDLNTNQVVGNYKAPALPHPIAIDEQDKLAYMMGVQSGGVETINMDTGQPVSNFTLQGGVGQMTLSTKLGKIVTSANAPGSSMTVFDLATKKNLGTIGFNGANTPGTSVAIDDATGLAFVVISDQDAIGVASLNTLKPLGYFKTGGCPYAVRLDSQRGKGYVTNSGDGTLTVFDLKDLESALQ
ncbi:MAG TPA: hypothetical protein VGS28_00350 [Candidatus Saccharimonadales bacterium]|nr:hypothetical protein [Candidatus Saccharimonadales bacterium]